MSEENTYKRETGRIQNVRNKKAIKEDNDTAVGSYFSYTQL